MKDIHSVPSADNFELSFWQKGSRTVLVPAFVFVVAMLLTLAVWRFTDYFIQQHLEAEFQSDVDLMSASISNRLEIYTNLLQGGKGLFDASIAVSAEEWLAYVESLELEEHYPGVQGMGYSTWIASSTLTEHIAYMQSERSSEYTVHPQGLRDEYTAIVYLEPFDIRNRQAFGFDMFQEATRKKAMIYARDIGAPALSGKVTLLQEIDENVQAGFLVYVPVYAKGVSLETPEERRTALLGFVYSPFRMDDFIASLFVKDHKSIRLEIFDDLNTERFNLERKMLGTSLMEIPDLSTTRLIPFGGHGWTARYSMLPGYGHDSLSVFVPIIFLFLGMLFSCLLFLFTYSLTTQRARAVALARAMTSDVQKKAQEVERIRKKLDVLNGELLHKASTLSDKIQSQEQFNALVVDRELKMIEIKRQLKACQESK